MASSITSLDLEPYALAMRRPFGVGAEQVRERRGLLARLADGDGHQGFGDVAPLPGLHAESLAQAEAALDQARTAWLGADAGDEDRVRALSAAAQWPSVRFGLETAWLHLRAAQLGRPPAELLCAQPRTDVEINALVDGEVREARAVLDSGELASYPVVKVKVGRRDPDAEHGLLALLLKELPEGVALRLDANRSLDLADACALLDGVDVDRIEYLEEPLRDPSKLATLHRTTGVRLGLDESLDEHVGTDDESTLHGPGIHAWVLKPGRHGALFASIAIAARAAEHGIRCVVSSCFESGVGLWSLAQLAASAGPIAIPAGLATDRWLASDVIEPRFSSTGGRVRLADAVNTPARG